MPVSAQKREIHWALLPTSPCSHIMWLQQNAVDNVRPFSARAASSRLRVSRDGWPINKDDMRRLRNRNHKAKMWQKLDLFWTSNLGLGKYWPLPSENQQTHFPYTLSSSSLALSLDHHHSSSLHLHMQTKKTFTACEYFSSVVLKGTLNLF